MENLKKLEQNLKNDKDFKLIETKIKDLLLNDFEDKLNKILLLKENEFLNLIFNKLKFSLIEIYTESSFEIEAFCLLVKNIERKFYEEYFKPTYTLLNNFYLNYSNSKEVNKNSQNKNNVQRSIDRFLPSKSKDNNNTPLTKYRRHCFIEGNGPFTPLLHSCKEPYVLVKEFNKNSENANSDFVMCLKCKECYSVNSILGFCSGCDKEYYTQYEEGNYKRYVSATFAKYHCVNFDNDKMNCFQCLNPFYLDMEDGSLYCEICNIKTDPELIIWKCKFCQKDFNSKVQVYNNLEYKPVKLAISDAVFNKINAKPFNLPCCGDEVLNNAKKVIFFHKPECKGEIYKAKIGKKEVIVCGKCKTITDYEKFNWTCPICLKRFRQKLKAEEKREEVINKNIENNNEVSNNSKNNSSKSNNYSSLSPEKKKNLKIDVDNKSPIKNSNIKSTNSASTTGSKSKITSWNRSVTSLEDNGCIYSSNNPMRESLNNKLLQSLNSNNNSKDISDNSKVFNRSSTNFNSNSNNFIINSDKKENKNYLIMNPSKKLELDTSNNNISNKLNINSRAKTPSNTDLERENNSKIKDNTLNNNITNNKNNTRNNNYSNYLNNLDKGKNYLGFSFNQRNSLNYSSGNKLNKLSDISNINNNTLNEQLITNKKNNDLSFNKSPKENLINKLNLSNLNSESYKKLNNNNNNNNKVDPPVVILNSTENKDNDILSIIAKDISSNNNELYTFNFEDYKIIKQIGEGTFGKIYLVEDKDKNQFSMKKIIANDDIELENFTLEYELVNKTQHTNILKILGLCKRKLDLTTFALYILMEVGLIDWEKEIKLRQKECKYYTEEELKSILKQINSSLYYLQTLNISHRDIKPQNILIFENSIYKIADFGEAKEINNKFMTNKLLNTLRGTELYMSPLLFNALRTNMSDIKHNAFKSDVFSLGLCLLYAATLSSQTIYEVRAFINSKQVYTLLNKILRGIYSQNFIDVLCKMLEIHEEQRFDFKDIHEIVLDY